MRNEIKQLCLYLVFKIEIGRKIKVFKILKKLMIFYWTYEEIIWEIIFII